MKSNFKRIPALFLAFPALVFASSSMPRLPAELQSAPSRWNPWAPRPELQPPTRYADSRWQIEAATGRTLHGGWELHWDKVKPGQWYRVEVICDVSDLTSVHDSVRAEWIYWNSKNGRADWRHVRWEPAGEKRLRYAIEMKAPSEAVRSSLRLALRWVEHGRIAWSEARLVAIPEPASRVIKAAISTGKFPGGSVEACVTFAVGLIEQAARAGANVVCLPEAITSFSARNLPREGARPIPGPETDALRAAARRANIDVVCSMNELDGELIYNTGLYIDGTRGILGKYRKVHISLGELWRGVTAGNEFPVWETRFGRAGMLICHDVTMPEAFRILARKGAEVIFMPIMNDARTKTPDPSRDHENWRNIMSVRAMDNHVWFVVCQNVGQWGLIARPDGRIMAEVDRSTGFAMTDVDLGFRFRSWNGSDFENRFWAERRPHLYGELEDDPGSVQPTSRAARE